ncbi:uncharacterized protein LOC128043023 [Gossypium raimondii]|uniref:uncharacterized protein LOC128043023 n=1 Tax=Gossypium raimondii TaxID=29730 RepID=UPI00227B8DC0|nr:uncharacterized protein LOC128043023 [Gossypium raimondii]
MVTGRDDDNLSAVIDVKIQLNLELDKDEAFYEQRVRANWLRLGNKNTAFFHKYASTRKKKNNIRSLKRGDGMITNTNDELGKLAMVYFQNLFSSNEKFTEEDVVAALKEMEPIKAPGFDGFPAMFLQKYWHIVKNDVLSYCLGVLNKAYAKVLANRLQGVIGKCVDCAQGAFVLGRLIFDNVLLAYKLLHVFCNKRTGKKGYMAVKLDMSKAYDRVEWAFLEAIMFKMGFFEDWIIRYAPRHVNVRASAQEDGTSYAPPVLPRRVNIPDEGVGPLLGGKEFFGVKGNGPTVVEYWLEGVGRILEQMSCSDKEKLGCDVSLLDGKAHLWWNTIRRGIVADRLT